MIVFYPAARQINNWLNSAGLAVVETVKPVSFRVFLAVSDFYPSTPVAGIAGCLLSPKLLGLIADKAYFLILPNFQC